jgi:hypothetical protein
VAVLKSEIDFDQALEEVTIDDEGNKTFLEGMVWKVYVCAHPSTCSALESRLVYLWRWFELDARADLGRGRTTGFPRRLAVTHSATHSNRGFILTLPSPPTSSPIWTWP